MQKYVLELSQLLGQQLVTWQYSREHRELVYAGC